MLVQNVLITPSFTSLLLNVLFFPQTMTFSEPKDKCTPIFDQHSDGLAVSFSVLYSFKKQLPSRNGRSSFPCPKAEKKSV